MVDKNLKEKHKGCDPTRKATNGQPGYNMLQVGWYCISVNVVCDHNIGNHRKYSGQGMWSTLYK